MHDSANTPEAVGRTVHDHFARQATPKVWEEVDTLRELLRDTTATLRAYVEDYGHTPNASEWPLIERAEAFLASGMETRQGGNEVPSLSDNSPTAESASPKPSQGDTE